MARLVAVLALVLFAVSLAVGTRGTQAQNTKLVATVGPGFTIVLRDASGARVTRLDPGTYDIEVQDLSNEHNFRLMGPGGLNRATEVEETGTVTWTVTLRDGTYRYWCDPHVSTMNGTFTVGSGGTNPPPTTGPVTPSTRLQLTSGPGFSITLRTAAGKAVRTMRTGTYTVVVRDRSRIHNARLRAPGYNRATGVPYVGTQRWRVRLARPGTLRFLCDPHAARMKGSARIVR